MTTHTPGPWKIKGNSITQDSDEPFPLDVCTIEGDDRQPEGTNVANARLIVAAPELLKMLKALLPFMDMAFEAEGDTFGMRHNDATDALLNAEALVARVERG